MKLNVRSYKNARPKLEYSSTVWDPYSKCQINQLEKIQRRTAHFVLHDYSNESSVTRMLTTHNWPTLQSRRKVTRLSVFHKALHHQIAVSLPNYLNTSTRHTRSNGRHHFIPPSVKTDKYSFFPRTVNDWNSLSPELSNSDKRITVKCRLISVGIGNPVVSIQTDRRNFNY